jgi:putative transcriptional regulator
MALTRMTSQQIAAAGGGRVSRTVFDATTEEDIRRHMIEDGEDPDAVHVYTRPLLPQAVRAKLGLTQSTFARLLGIPLGTLRNWEQNRFVMEPAALALLTIIDREPEAALRALSPAAASAEP